MLLQCIIYKFIGSEIYRIDRTILLFGLRNDSRLLSKSDFGKTVYIFHSAG